MTPAKLLESNLTLGQLLVDETELVMLHQDFKSKLILDDVLCTF
jgi:hypothetical protein